MSGKDLAPTPTMPGTVHVPLATELVSAMDVEVASQALYNFCQAVYYGKIVVQSGVTMLVNSGGAITCNGTVTLNGTGASATSIAQLNVGPAGGTYAGGLTGPVGAFGWPASPSDRSFTDQENNAAQVSASNSFVMRKDITVSGSVPAGIGGVTTSPLWVTPDTPWILEGMALQVVSDCSADADPGTVAMTVYIGTVGTIACPMSAFAGGTLYLVDGTTTNKTIFGMKVSEKYTLLTPPYADSGTDQLGFAVDEVNLAVLALAVGDTVDMFGKSVTMRVTHDSGSARTLSLPLRLYIWGRLL